MSKTSTNKETRKTAAFTSQRQPFDCAECGKKTTGPAGVLGPEVCAECYDKAGILNAHADGLHRAEPDAECLECQLAVKPTRRGRTENPARRTRRAAEKPSTEAATPTPAPSPTNASPAAEITAVRPWRKEPVAERIRPVKAGTKMAAILDLLARKQGATLDELQALLSPKSPIRTVLNWDMNTRLGYGFIVGIDGLVQLTLPKGMKAPMPHTPTK